MTYTAVDANSVEWNGGTDVFFLKLEQRSNTSEKWCKNMWLFLAAKKYDRDCFVFGYTSKYIINFVVRK